MTRDEDAVAKYDALLGSIGRNAEAIGSRRLASHWPHVGRNYRGLVIAGQALQGWDVRVQGARWHAKDAATAEGRARIINSTQTWMNTGDDPVGVIATLTNRRGSPFWSLCRDVVTSLESEGTGPWYSRFAWANVYPVGPDEPPGSPAGALKEAQDPHVGGLFASVLDVIEARRVVVISGPGFWWHAGRTEDLASLPMEQFPLIRAGRADGRTVVVGYHPTYARRRRVTAAAYSDRILGAIGRVETGFEEK